MLSRWFRRGVNLDLWDEAAEGLLGVVKERIEAGANVNARRKPPVEPLPTSHGFSMIPVRWTPLMYASWFGQAEMVRLLLENGADPNLESYGPNTALIDAVIAGHHKVIVLLLEANAKVDFAGQQGRTARDWAAICGHDSLLEYLLLKHPSQNLDEAIAYNDISGARRLITAGVDVNAVDFIGRTSLDIAVTRNNEIFVSLLSEFGARHSPAFLTD
jgi:ankyrin repeat protein